MSLGRSLNAVSHNFASIFGRVPGYVWVVIMAGLNVLLVFLIMNASKAAIGAQIDESDFLSPDYVATENEYLPPQAETQKETKSISEEVSEDPLVTDMSPETVDESDGDLIVDDSAESPEAAATVQAEDDGFDDEEFVY